MNLKTENIQVAEKNTSISSEINIPVTFLNKQSKVYEYRIEELKRQHKKEIKYWKTNFLACLISLLTVLAVIVVLLIIWAR